LVHFNGSRKQFGCNADGHSHVTNIQFIPDESLINVLKFAKNNGIPCVTE
jgi:endonuclease IV